MARQSILKIAESFRHAILYLIREAHSNGFKRVGISLEEAERAIDKELDVRGLSRDGSRDRSKQSGGNVN